MSIKVFTAGESMGLFIGESIDSLDMLTTARITTAGSEGNVAIGLSRLGVQTTWASRLGDDQLGARIRKDLISEGVHVIAQKDSQNPTGLMIKTTPRAGETVVTYYRSGSAASKLSSSDFASVQFQDFNLVHLTGITPALSDSAKATTLYLAQEAKAAGCLLSFDVNFRSKLWTDTKASETLMPLVLLADIFIGSQDEAALFIDNSLESIEQITAAIHQLGPHIVVIKQGNQGATVSINSEIFSSPALEVEVVDTVGAGDAFTSGFLALFLETKDVEAALRAGIVSGAMACMHPGDWQGLPKRTELINFNSTDPVKR